MKKLFAAAAFAFSLPIHAAVVDFEDLGVASGGQLNPADNAVITSGGFDFVNGPTSAISDMHFPNDGFAGIGSTTELVTHGDLLMTKNGGGTFSLNSFDFGSWLLEVPSFTVNGLLSGGGMVSQSFNLDGDETTFETFFLNPSFTNLVSANWLMSSGNQKTFNIDNIKADINAVPLPAAVWLFGPALLGFLGLRRKQK
tara:strand:+ start:549 stop:1142 length:594 start_codon:yes stop_codon:yes gene_type:complete